MIKRELIEYFSEVARVKNVERSELGTILEQLFLHIIERERGDSSNCSVIVNLDKGEIEIYAEKQIVEEVMEPIFEITLEEAQKTDPSLEIGDTFVEVIETEEFGRRLIHTAKQFFSQKLLDVEKQYIYEDYANRIGEIVIGAVHQIHRENVFVNIEQAELRMPRKEQISSERYRRGDTIRALIKSVEVTPKGPDIVISRSDNYFLYKLFEMEVPEIEDGFIEITSIARQPGDRAKIIVKSTDRRIDPVGACVGMRGSRIQAIVRELNNEKIDIVNHSDQPEILISRALSPAKPINLYIDDERKYCAAIFQDGELDSAIGRAGVNINLASRLTGYRIDAYGEKQYQLEQDIQGTALEDVAGFPKQGAKSLAGNGIISISDLTAADEDTILAVKGVGEKTLENMYDSVQIFSEESLTNLKKELEENAETHEEEEPDIPAESDKDSSDKTDPKAADLESVSTNEEPDQQEPSEEQEENETAPHAVEEEPA